jgi:hypothetical protein
LLLFICRFVWVLMELHNWRLGLDKTELLIVLTRSKF